MEIHLNFKHSEHNFPKKQYFKQISQKDLFNIAGVLYICNKNNEIEICLF